jgi:hypothetical protein
MGYILVDVLIKRFQEFDAETIEGERSEVVWRSTRTFTTKLFRCSPRVFKDKTRSYKKVTPKQGDTIIHGKYIKK